MVNTFQFAMLLVTGCNRAKRGNKRYILKIYKIDVVNTILKLIFPGDGGD